MKRNLLSVLTAALVLLIGVTGCPTPNKSGNPTLTGISADYAGTMPIYPDTPLDGLKDSLTVTATYSNGTGNILDAADYTLSGILTVGNSAITVTCEDKTTVFTVTVSARIPIESPPMQVYSSDKTTLYDGDDLDFYIQGDTEKTITATIRNGKLVITYNQLPGSCVLVSVNTSGGLFSNVQNATEGLQYYEIILISTDEKKRLRYRDVGDNSWDARPIYFNKDGSFTSGSNNTPYNVRQGWNFAFRGASTDPKYYETFEGGFRWIVWEG